MLNNVVENEKETKFTGVKLSTWMLTPFIEWRRNKKCNITCGKQIRWLFIHSNDDEYYCAHEYSNYYLFSYLELFKFFLIFFINAQHKRYQFSMNINAMFTIITFTIIADDASKNLNSSPKSNWRWHKNWPGTL